MSFNIEVQGGKNYLLPTAGKYCPQDIEIAAIGGATEGMYCWAKYDKESLILPDDYTEVSYLQASANCAVNTGVIPNGNTRLKIKFNASGNGAPFGSEKAFQNAAYAAIRSSTSYYCYQTQSYSPAISAGTDYEVDFNGAKLNINGSLAKTFTAATIDTTYPLYLFASNRAGATPEPFNGKIYSRVEIYEDGVNLSRYLITCKDADGNYGMYDVVNKEMLYNIGSGAFTAGEEIETDRVEGVTPIAYVLSDDLNAYPQDGYGEDGFYYKRLEDNIPWHEAGSYVWSKSDADGNLIAYVVSDDPSEFPEDGQGDDGYYYKLQNMGGLQYASGSGSTPADSYNGSSFTVSGVAFRPKTLYISWIAAGSTYNNTIVADFNGSVKQANSYNGSTINITDDGFTFFTNSGLYPSNTLSYSWMATGV